METVIGRLAASPVWHVLTATYFGYGTSSLEPDVASLAPAPLLLMSASTSSVNIGHTWRGAQEKCQNKSHRK